MTPAYDPGPDAEHWELVPRASGPMGSLPAFIRSGKEQAIVPAERVWETLSAKSAEIARLNEDNNQYVKEHTDDTLLIARLEARVAELEAERVLWANSAYVPQLEQRLARLAEIADGEDLIELEDGYRVLTPKGLRKIRALAAGEEADDE